jgi:hypothetical protein
VKKEAPKKKVVEKDPVPFSTGTGKNDLAFEVQKGRTQNQAVKSKKRSTSSGSEIEDSSDDDEPVVTKKSKEQIKKEKIAEEKRLKNE